MTEQQIRPPMEAKTIVKCASLGQPMAALADDSVNKVVVGRIIGYAVGVSHSTVEDRMTGEVKDIRSLVGSFKAIPTDLKRACTSAAKLGLPEHMTAPILNYFEPPGTERSKGGVTGEMVQVAFDIGVERAKNPAGYSWYAIPLLAPGERDPITEMEKALASSDVPVAQIEHKPESRKTKAA